MKRLIASNGVSVFYTIVGLASQRPVYRVFAPPYDAIFIDMDRAGFLNLIRAAKLKFFKPARTPYDRAREIIGL